MRAFPVLVQTVVLLASSVSMATDWTVKADDSQARQYFRQIEKIKQNEFALSREEQVAKIRQGLESQGVNTSNMTITPMEFEALPEELYPNSPYRIEAIRRGSEEDDVERFYRLGMRDASFTNPDFDTYLVMVKAKFSFNGGLRNLKMKTVEPRVYFADKDDKGPLKLPDGK